MQNYYEKLIGLLPKFENKEFYDILSQCTEIEVVEKGHCLINFQSSAKKLFMIIEGAVITDFVGSNGEKRTIMFHTEQFCPFFKSYDVFFQHKHSCYEVRATEHTVVAVIDLFLPIYFARHRGAAFLHPCYRTAVSHHGTAAQQPIDVDLRRVS